MLTARVDAERAGRPRTCIIEVVDMKSLYAFDSCSRIVRQTDEEQGLGGEERLTRQGFVENGPATEGRDGELRAIGSAMVRVISRSHGA
jgi:hypothetical protein